MNLRFKDVCDRVAICYVSDIQEVLELALVEGKATT